MKFPENIMYTAPFAFLQSHNQFFPSSQHNFWKKFCVLLFNAIYYQHTKFFLKFLLGTWKKLWLWGWREANGAVQMIFSHNIISNKKLISLYCCYHLGTYMESTGYLSAPPSTPGGHPETPLKKNHFHWDLPDLD